MVKSGGFSPTVYCRVHPRCNTIPGMPTDDLAFLEDLCDRFMLAREATGLTKAEFARRVGLSSPQLTNISKYRNPPSHAAIRNACREFGFPANWFYEGVTFGVRDAEIAERLRGIVSR